jgi:type II secretory pathway component PulF
MWTKSLKQSLWFTEQFQQLHQSGLGFAESLVLLEQSVTDSHFKVVIRRVLHSVKKGRTFSQSLRHFPGYFSPTYIAMIVVGEQSGYLGRVLEELAAYLNVHINVRQSILQALTYPALLLTIMLGLLIFLLWFVIPQFEAVFMQFKAPLPPLTAALFGLVHHFKTLGLFAVITIGGGGIFLRKLITKHWQIMQKKRFLLSIPWIGSYYQDWLLMFLFKTLALSLRSGLSLQDGLKLLPKLLGHTPFGQLILLLQQGLQEGHPLEKIFDQSGYLPPICQAYIKIATLSGALDQQLYQLGLHFEARVYAKMTQFKVLLEPMILLSMGGLVGVVVIALYQPLFSLGGMV